MKSFKAGILLIILLFSVQAFAVDYEVDSSLADQGANVTGSAMSACTVIGSKPGTIRFPSGKGQGYSKTTGITTYTLGQNTNFTAVCPNATFDFTDFGAKISHGAYTLNIPNRDIGIIPHHWLIGTGTVTLGGNTGEVYHEEFAINTTPGTTDMSAAVQASMDTALASNIKLRALAKSYAIATGITETDKNELKWEGVYSNYWGNGTVYKWTGAANGTMFDLKGCRGVMITGGFQLDGNTTASVGIHNEKSATPASADYFNGYNIYGKNFNGTIGTPIYFGQTATDTGRTQLHLYNYYALDSKEGIRFEGGGGQSCTIHGGRIYNNSVYGVNLLSGWLTTVELQIHYNAIQYNMGTGNNTLNLFGGYFEYSNTERFLNYTNHDGGFLNMIGTTHAGVPLATHFIDYGGGKFIINSIGNSFDSDSIILAANGNQLVQLSSINDVFTDGTSGWVNNTGYDYTNIVSGSHTKDGPTGTLVDWAVGTVADGAGLTSAAITVSGTIAVGDIVEVGAPYDLLGVTVTGYISNAGAKQVTIRLQNESASAFTPGNTGTWKVRVRRSF